MKISNSLLVLFLIAKNTIAQAPPGTEIFITDLSINNSVLSCSKGINITKRKGYDSQPSFSPVGNFILYTSIREDLQADVYKYDFKKHRSIQVTKTKEDEYSPTVMPGGKQFSVVRVEADSTQRLWSFELDGKKFSLINPYVDSIGYHCWINPKQLAVFILTEPFTLQLCNTLDGQTKMLAKDIGRSIHKKDDKNILFTQLIDSARWICSVNIESGSISTLAKCIEGSEDFAVYGENVLLMAKESKLFQLDLRKSNDWVMIGDFSEIGANKINRIALSPDRKKLAFVNLEE